MNYTEKEKDIIKQCNHGPFHTLVIELNNNEFDCLVDKLINDNDSYTLTSLIAIYRDYNRDKIIEYLINKKDVEILLSFLNYCYDFDTPINKFNQKSIVDKLIETNDKTFIKNILNSNNLYFLTDKEVKQLRNYLS